MLAVLFVFLLAAVIGGLLWLLTSIFNRRYIDLSAIEAPSWVQQDFFDRNPYSRPGTKMAKVNEIVIHYVANPGTTAKNNWNYFNNLKDQKEESGSKNISASSHFIIGLDGEILQGIPIDEIAYATSKEKNMNTVSIECCHPDETGKFTEETYDSLVELTAWLCHSLDLTSKDVIRHYDATGKDCPRYFVAHEDEWKQFKKDVKKALK
jgi:N-acetylmuramoyl-L-alanine amidase CwlA